LGDDLAKSRCWDTWNFSICLPSTAILLPIKDTSIPVLVKETDVPESTDLVTAEIVVKHLNLSRRGVLQLAKQGSLAAVRVGSELLFSRDQVSAFLRHRTARMRYFLVIDDAPAVCSPVKKALENEGHIVLTTTSGAEGLEFIKEIHFDHIFLDLKMPGMDGADIINAINQMGKNIPVTIITGYPDGDIMAWVETFCAAYRVIVKPFNVAQVVAVSRED
jgi:excisionase family DNA binding protein